MSDFDLTSRFEEEKEADHKYTVQRMMIDLQALLASTEREKQKRETDAESYLKTIRSNCAKIFPSCKKVDFTKMEPIERFQYLKFFYYIGKTHEKWREDGYKLFECLQSPSERYCQRFSDMLDEILENNTEIALTAQINKELKGYKNQGYAEPCHTVHQWISMIATALPHMYMDVLDRLRESVDQFCEILGEYDKKSEELDTTFDCKLTCWDELGLILAYSCGAYWEQDLLCAHSTVYNIASNAEALSPEAHRLLLPDLQYFSKQDQCFLVFRDGKIEEIADVGQAQMDDVSDEVYLQALESYVKDHIEELTSKIFSKDVPDYNDTRRVKNRFSKFRAYWEMERQRYGRNCALTKLKLIAAYQVIFMTLPSSGINFSKMGTPRQRVGGRLFREGKALSSSYANASEKEPRYLQLICVWTDSQNLRLSLPAWCREFYANLYSLVNVETLKRITSMPWNACLRAIQARAESILFLTTEALIPIEEDMQELEVLRQHLSSSIGETHLNIPSEFAPSVYRLGAYCKLFGAKCIGDLVIEEVKKQVQPGPFLVSLNSASEGAIVLQGLVLAVDYSLERKNYLLEAFPPHSVDDLLRVEKRIVAQANRLALVGV